MEGVLGWLTPLPGNPEGVSRPAVPAPRAFHVRLTSPSGLRAPGGQCRAKAEGDSAGDFWSGHSQDLQRDLELQAASSRELIRRYFSSRLEKQVREVPPPGARPAPPRPGPADAHVPPPPRPKPPPRSSGP